MVTTYSKHNTPFMEAPILLVFLVTTEFINYDKRCYYSIKIYNTRKILERLFASLIQWVSKDI